VVEAEFLLGVDGGGTQCRARLTERSFRGDPGTVLGEGVAGPANIRLGLLESFAAVLEATHQCLDEAGLGSAALGRTAACLALAGATEPALLAAARRRPLPFASTTIVTDAQAACIGAHGGQDGAIVVIGTGSIGWAEIGGRRFRAGGWGMPISDEGSGAWLGCEALRRALWAHDGRIAWTPLLTALFAEFDADPHAIVRWAGQARPGDYGRFARLVVEHAERGDPVGRELMRSAAVHINALAARLGAFGTPRLALVGGLAASIEPYLSSETRERLVPPQGDALSGALRLAATSVSMVAAQ
jgi:glucosamine kinase